jgi:hypothetical protein
MQELYYNDLLDFIRVHSKNWVYDIAQAPYYITAKQCPFKDNAGNLLYPEAYMVSYSQFESDFTNSVVKACRGSIVDVSDLNSPDMICTPFYKFMNHGQEGEDEIDWSTAKVRDKIDGMLMKCWYSEKLKRWIWVSNNGWDINCQLPETLISKYEEEDSKNAETFWDLLKLTFKHANLSEDWYEELDKNYTYMFELVSPKTRIICDYPKTELWYLGCRDIRTWKEWNPEQVSDNPILKAFKHPEIYADKNIEEVLARCDGYNNIDKEGVVVCDANFHRFKIKCNEYLKIKFAKHEMGISEKFLLQCIRDKSEDDLLGIFPELKTKLDDLKLKLKEFKNEVWSIVLEGRIIYRECIKLNTDERSARKAYAEMIKNKPSIIKSIMFLVSRDDDIIDQFIQEKNLEYIDNLLNGEKINV